METGAKLEAMRDLEREIKEGSEVKTLCAIFMPGK